MKDKNKVNILNKKLTDICNLIAFLLTLKMQLAHNPFVNTGYHIWLYRFMAELFFYGMKRR